MLPIESIPLDILGTPPHHWPRDILTDLIGLQGSELEDAIDRSRGYHAHTQPPRFPEMDLAHEASAFQGSGNSIPESNVPADEADWELIAEFPLDRLKPLLGLQQDWYAWFREEADDRPGSYDELLFEPTREPLVIFELEDGRLDIWDGWHRAFAGALAGRDCVPVILGRPRPAPLARPR